MGRVALIRSGGSEGAISVAFRIEGFTATLGTDFNPASGTVTWRDGEMGIRFIEIEIVDDAKVEGPETFKVRLPHPPFSGPSIQVRIVDDESGISLAGTDLSIREAENAVPIAVWRSGDSGTPTSVHYATSPGTATAGPDFTTTSGTLNWAAGESGSKPISVGIKNDGTDESDETFAVTLSNPSAGTPLGPHSTATVTIVDDDSSGGDLDPSFDGNGVLSLRVGDSEAAALAVAQQADGKLVLAGWGQLNGSDNVGFMVARVAENGTPDSSFGTDGIASTDFSALDDFVSDVVQQTDGKLVLAGTATTANGSQDIALARFNADGTLDSTFGNGGKATLDIGGSHDFASGLIQQPGGKLVIAGGTVSGNQYRLVFARFDTNGTLDTTFGNGGTTLVDFGGGTESWANDLAQQPDGRLVAVGRVHRPVGPHVGIARVTANGALDSSFDGDGLLAVDVEGEAFGVAIQPDGAIIAAGYAVPPGGTGGAALLRVNGDGRLDNSFGTAGIAGVDLGDAGVLNSIVVQADGKLVATGGSSTDAGGEDMILARFDSEGALDTSYGINGVTTADFGTGDIAPPIKRRRTGPASRR